MKAKLLLLGLLLVASTGTAFAEGPYIAVAGGVSFIQDSDYYGPGYYSETIGYDTGYGVNVSGGYDFDGLRFEVEYGYKEADITDFSGYSPGNAKASFESIMFNHYVDFNSNSGATPYIGAGVGFIKGELNDNGYIVEDTVMGYQLITGIGFNLSKSVTLDISYRLQEAASDFEKNGDAFSYTSSIFYSGLRYKF